jgi:hypothetical protein
MLVESRTVCSFLAVFPIRINSDRVQVPEVSGFSMFLFEAFVKTGF